MVAILQRFIAIHSIEKIEHIAGRGNQKQGDAFADAEKRQLAINNPPILRRIFVCLKFCCVERIAGYVTEATRLKTDKKARKVGGLLIASSLRLHE